MKLRREALEVLSMAKKTIPKDGKAVFVTSTRKRGRRLLKELSVSIRGAVMDGDDLILPGNRRVIMLCAEELTAMTQ